MDKEIYYIIERILEKRRNNSIFEFEKRKAAIYKQYPELQEIEKQIKELGLKFSKSILKDSSFSPELLKQETENLKRRKINILVKNGLPSNILKPTFKCSLCQDTGFITKDDFTTKCNCFNQELINILHSRSNLKLASHENFDSFNENFYSEEINYEKYKVHISPRTCIKEIKEIVLGFIREFGKTNEKNLFFSGKAGVGKTFMSSCIANELLKKGYTVVYCSAPNLFEFIGTHKLKQNNEINDTFIYKSYYDCDLLIIDDLGTEGKTTSRYSELLTILNTRSNKNLTKVCKTIISSNIDLNNLKSYYDERIMSRIFGNFRLIRFFGDDIRQLKARN